MWTLMLAWLSVTALAADGPKDLCDGQIGGDQLECIKAKYPKDFSDVEATCADPANAPKRACRVTRYAAIGIDFVAKSTSGPEKSVGGEISEAPPETRSGRPGINRAALTSASAVLSVAGAGLQLAPTLCSLDKKCKLSDRDKALIASFSVVVSDAGTQVPAILSGRGTDAEKAAKLVGLAKRLEAGIPTGLSDQAQGLIGGALTSVQGFMPLLFSLGAKPE